MVEFTINGKNVRAEKDETILNVARREGFDIPTLCYNDTLGSDGRCRLCMVEVRKGRQLRRKGYYGQRQSSACSFSALTARCSAFPEGWWLSLIHI